MTPTVTLTARYGSSSWIAIDTGPVRSFAQSVVGLAAPTIASCAVGPKYATWIYTYDTILFKWSAVPGATSYDIYNDGVKVASTSSAVTQLNANSSAGSPITRAGSITVRAVGPSHTSAPSNMLAVTITDPVSGFGSNNVYCGALE